MPDPRIEPLARAMCAAAGNNPNGKVFPAVGYALERIQGRADYQKVPPDFVVVPAWELWVGDAEAALAHIGDLHNQVLARHPILTTQAPVNKSSF